MQPHRTYWLGELWDVGDLAPQEMAVSNLTTMALTPLLMLLGGAAVNTTVQLLVQFPCDRCGWLHVDGVSRVQVAVLT